MKRPRPPVLSAALATVIAALLSAVGGFVGAKLGAEATLHAQQVSIDAAREDEQRTKRAEVYPAFLDAANEYQLAVDEARRQIAECGEEQQDVECTGGIIERAALLTPRANFQGATNLLYVYGSDAAWAAGSALYGTLPTARGSLDPRTLIDPIPPSYSTAYERFLDVMCSELPTRPRAGCT